MPRKVIKPFAVEVRKAGRKIKAAALSWPADPAIASVQDDQPRVVWPELDRLPLPGQEAAEPHALAPAPIKGRILPALDEPASIIEEPRKRRKNRRHAQAEVADTDDVPVDQNRLGAADLVPEAMEAKPFPPTAGYALRVVEVENDKPILRRERKRIARSEFKRSERWRARLPIAAQRSKPRRQGS